MSRTPKIAIVGGGFAGLHAARALCDQDVDITLVDRRNHHLFQPLLYQVATAGLSPADISVPLRAAVGRNPNVTVAMGNVSGIDLSGKQLQLDGGAALDYDYLLLAAGSRPNYFGNDDWGNHAPSLKSLQTAVSIRERVLLSLEKAELTADPVERQKLLTFVVVGAGPTGVELAGALAELGHLAIPREYKRIGPEDVRVVLIEMADRVLPPFAAKSSQAAKRMLEELGVEVLVSHTVKKIDETRVAHDQGEILSNTVVWASGVKPAGLAQVLDVEKDRKGGIVVQQDCSLPGHENVFVLGDMASFTPPGAERPLPALASVAVQQGKYFGQVIEDDLRRRPRKPFEYNDRGQLATVGRGRAVADIGKRQLAGTTAWCLWSLVHVYQLIGMQNRMSVLLDWAWQYLTPGRRLGKRVIVSQPAPPIVTPAPSGLLSREAETDGRESGESQAASRMVS